MIVTLAQVKARLGISEEDDSQDDALTLRIQALECAIRARTNNKFQDIRVRSSGTLAIVAANKSIAGDLFQTRGFRVGNLIEINSIQNRGLFTVSTVSDSQMTVSEALVDETDAVLITKVVYPLDIQQGVLDLIKYDQDMRDKAGIKSETISRHSVTYYDMTAAESLDGYPASMLSFVDKYRKLRW